jgi:hypothetical protein
MKSTVGRPRKVTDAQIARILAWHDDFLVWQAERQKLQTITTLAEEMGLSRATISAVIKHRGEYKQGSPEKREMELKMRRERMSELRGRGRRVSTKRKK